MEKTYTLNKYGETYTIALRKGNYLSNGALAIEMVLITEEGEEPWSRLTTNLDSNIYSVLGDNEQFIDTNNNGEDIIQWLEDNKIGTNGRFAMESGFCTYPLFRFDTNVLAQMKDM